MVVARRADHAHRFGGAAHGGIGQAVGIGKSGFLARYRPHAHALVDLETAGLDHAFFQMPALKRSTLAVDVGIIDMVGADQIEAGVQVFGTQSVCMQQPLANGIKHGKIIHKRFSANRFQAA